MNTTHKRKTGLPVRWNLTPAYTSSLIVAALLVAASVAGLLYPAAIYPADELLLTFLSNDVVNLVIGLPILLGSMWLSRRGQLYGLLCWPGALFFVLYNYLVYVFAMPLNAAFLLHVALVAFSAYTLVALVAGIDGKEVKRRLAGAVPERFAGGVLAGLGLLFVLWALADMVTALAGQTPLAETEQALHITDFLVSPAWIIGGLLLWHKKAFGYVTGLGLLFQASALFIGLIISLLLQPLITTVPFALADVVVIFIMGLVCFIPFALFLRGAMSERSPSSSDFKA